MYSFFKSFSIDIFAISLFSLYAVVNLLSIATATVHMLSMLVGTSGLEPPTSRLSGECSNQLSYVPVIIVAKREFDYLFSLIGLIDPIRIALKNERIR